MNRSRSRRGARNFDAQHPPGVPRHDVAPPTATLAPPSAVSHSRRRLLLGAGAALAAPLLWRCGGDGDDDAPLAPACVDWGIAADPNARVVAGYRGLAALPYFELDCAGRLRCTVPDLQAFDVHAHLGFCFLNCPAPDYLAPTEPTRYLLDCDGQTPPTPVDLNDYANRCASDEMLVAMDDELIAALGPTWSDVLRTHTVVNLLAEMDAMGIERTVLLAIAMGLSTHDDQTNEYLDAVAAAGASERLLVFGSVHPNDPHKGEKLRAYAARGIRAVKVHPPMQRIYPDSDEAMEIYAECDALDLPVLLHSGRAGIEPAATAKFAEARYYERGPAEFPNVTFVLAHAGAYLDFDGCLDLAKRYPNLWLDLAGPGIPAIERLLAELGPERLLYGTDWPFYSQALALAKVLIATEGDATVRRMLLRENAHRLLG